MLPEIWGPYAWTMLHTIAFTSPPGLLANGNSKIREAYRLHLESLQTILPCPQCREHYTEHYEEDPPRLEALVDWMGDLHNYVNRRKEVAEWTREQVYEKYFPDGVLHISHPDLFRWMDIVAGASEDSNLETFQDYIIFFTTLAQIFPCSYCRERYAELLENYPISEVYDSESLRAWWNTIEKAWKKSIGVHYYAGQRAFILYNRGRQWFTKEIKMDGVEQIDCQEQTVDLLGPSGKSTIRVDGEQMKVVTSSDLGYARKIVAHYS